MHKTAIIVPCYNEAVRLPSDDFAVFAETHPDIDFIFVNDGSTDNTDSVLQRLSEAKAGQIHILSLTKNQGKAEAVRQGCLQAFGMSYQFIGYWDADLATPLGVVEDFLRLIVATGSSMIMASRVRLLGRSIERREMRHYLGRVFATMASWVLELHVYDTQCGAKLFRNTAPMRSAFDKPFTARWIFDVELLARMSVLERRCGAKGLLSTVIEAPLAVWREVSGSKLKPRDFISAIFELYRIYRFLHAQEAQVAFVTDPET